MKVLTTRPISRWIGPVLAATATCAAVALAAGGPVASAHPVEPAQAVASCPSPGEPMRHFLPIDVPVVVVVDACVAPVVTPMPGFPTR